MAKKKPKQLEAVLTLRLEIEVRVPIEAASEEEAEARAAALLDEVGLDQGEDSEGVTWFANPAARKLGATFTETDQSIDVESIDEV